MSESPKSNVLLLFGGKSVEHDISLRSAVNVGKNLDRSRFEVIPVGIDRRGMWFLTDAAGSFEGAKPAALLPGGQLLLIETHETLPLDIVFPILHGTDGEDGSIQGWVTAAGLPLVGSGVLGSAAAMSKLVSKRLMEAAGIPVAKYLALDRDSPQVDYAAAAEKLGNTMIVKPANLGSSIGVSKVSNPGDYQKALKVAFTYDQQVMVEEFITGRELECAILGNEDAKASAAGEIIIRGDYEFYDFDAKYVDPEGVQITIPAKVDGMTDSQIRKLSVDAYKAVGCQDYSRVDLFLTPDGSVYINEINTIPGFTDISMFPMLWKNEGIEYSDLLSRLIALAMKRHQEEQRLEKEFKSSLS